MTETTNKNTKKSDAVLVWLLIIGVIVSCLMFRSCEANHDDVPTRTFHSDAPTAVEKVEDMRQEQSATDAGTEAMEAADAVQRGDAAGAVAHERYHDYANERANRQ